MTICGLWTVAIIATIPILFGTELVDAIYVDGSIVSACITKANTTWQRLYFIVSIIGFFALPLVILIVVYCIITKRLVRDDRRLLIASIHSTLATSGSIMADGSDCKKLRSGSLPQQFIQQSSLSNESTCGTTITMNQSSSIWHHPAAMFLFRGSIASLGANSRRGSTSVPVASNLNQQQQQQQPRRNSSVIAARSVARSRRQVIIMLAAVVICFFLCLLPFRLFTLWLVLVTEEEIRALSMERFYQLLYFCRVMIYVNSMLNPLLYAVVSSKFRRAFVDTIKQLFNNCCFCDFCGCCWWSWWWCALWCCCCCFFWRLLFFSDYAHTIPSNRFHVLLWSIIFALIFFSILLLSLLLLTYTFAISRIFSNFNERMNKRKNVTTTWSWTFYKRHQFFFRCYTAWVKPNCQMMFQNISYPCSAPHIALWMNENNNNKNRKNKTRYLHNIFSFRVILCVCVCVRFSYYEMFSIFEFFLSQKMAPSLNIGFILFPPPPYTHIPHHHHHLD